ncbi:MAG: hypothetical protein IJX29_05850 [Bacteroides sp.]|nr:hypothetical protein [Bacteroides sp.]
MKTRSILMTTLCSLMLGMGFTACSDDDDEPEPVIDPVEYPVYILNEGIWGSNNANITSFIPNYKAENLSDVYLKVNGTQMGDLANAMIEEDDNIYVVMNGSKYVSRLDLTIKEQGRYTFPESEGAPRCIDVEDNYAYVTQYGGQVSKLNIKDMTLAGTFKDGDNLEGIVEKDGKLYVANSYTVDGSNNWIYNKEVFVIDAKTMTLEKTIEVVENPTKMYEIDGKIYLLSAGNYYDVEAALQIIDPTTGTARKITSAAKITEGNDELIYGVRSAYDENWQFTNNFFVYNPKLDEVSDTSFLQNAPASFSTDAIYLLEVDEETGFIYVGTSDYTTNGTIYQFDKGGKFVQSFDSGGINPSTMVFIN